MRHTKQIHLLLASVLAASAAFAQTTDGQAADSVPAEVAISAARSQYIPVAAIPAEADNRKTLAQFGRRSPGPPFAPHHGYPSGGYQTPWVHQGGAGHVVIGAAIGFGIGAALGAHQNAHNGNTVTGGIIVGGGLFGLLGGCVGKAVGDFSSLRYSSAHRRRDYRPSWPEDDEESDLHSHSKAREGQ